jgi:hypothetical protein
VGAASRERYGALESDINGKNRENNSDGGAGPALPQLPLSPVFDFLMESKQARKRSEAAEEEAVEDSPPMREERKMPARGTHSNQEAGVRALVFFAFQESNCAVTDARERGNRRVRPPW